MPNISKDDKCLSCKHCYLEPTYAPCNECIHCMTEEDDSDFRYELYEEED